MHKRYLPLIGKIIDLILAEEACNSCKTYKRHTSLVSTYLTIYTRRPKPDSFLPDGLY